MASQVRKTLAFAPWTPFGSGPFTIRFTLANEPDEFPANNVLSMVVIKTGLATSGAVPQGFVLAANYPNPFNSRTAIHLVLPMAGKLEVSIYSSTGQPVWSWQELRAQAGERELLWDGQSDQQASVASGVYFCRVSLTNAEAVSQSATIKMLLLK